MFRHLNTRETGNLQHSGLKQIIVEVLQNGDENTVLRPEIGSLPDGAVILLNKDQFGAHYRIYPHVSVSILASNDGRSVEIEITDEMPLDAVVPTSEQIHLALNEENDTNESDVEASITEQRIFGVKSIVDIEKSKSPMEQLGAIISSMVQNFNSKASQSITSEQVYQILENAIQRK